MSDGRRTGKKTARGVTYALISVVAFGSLVPCAKMCLDGMMPFQFAAFLLLGAGVGTGCIIAVRKAASGSRASAKGKPEAPKLALVSVLNAAAVALLAFGLHYTFAANASLLMGFEIAAATVFAWILLGRHVCYKACAAIALMCIASFLLCWNVEDAPMFVPGSLLIVAACVIRGYEGAVKKSFADKDPLLVACIRSFSAGLVLLIVALGVDGAPAIAPAYLAGALFLGFMTFGLGAAFHLAAQRDLGSARAESYFALAPFAGLLISWGRFGFALEPLFFGALAFMALGVWLAMDDSVFHEDALAEYDREYMLLYAGEAGVFELDRMHRPVQR